MKLKLFTSLDELRAHAHQWDEVAGDFPFFRFAWMGNWMQHLGRECQLAVLVGMDDQGNWQGIAPWCIDHTKGVTRKLRWMSSGTACGDYLKLITRQESATAFATAAADWLDDNIGSNRPLGHLDAIELEGVALSDSNAKFFTDLLEAGGFQTHTSELEGSWWVNLPNEWAALEAQCSKSMRRKTKKAAKRLLDPQTNVRSTRVGATCGGASEETAFDELWENFVALHQQRRQALGQAGCFADERFEAFLRSAVRELIESDHAEITEIQHAGAPLASMLLLNDADTVYMYQSGSCNQRSAVEPGYQMVACAIQRAIAAGYKTFDFLRGDEPYKARWNTQRVALSRVKFIPRGFSAQLKHSLWLTGRSLKHCWAADSAE